MRLDKELHLIAIDEVWKLVKGNLTGSLHRAVRAQKAANHIHRHVQVKERRSARNQHIRANYAHACN